MERRRKGRREGRKKGVKKGREGGRDGGTDRRTDGKPDGYRAFSLTWAASKQIFWKKESVYIRKEFNSHSIGLDG